MRTHRRRAKTRLSRKRRKDHKRGHTSGRGRTWGGKKNTKKLDRKRKRKATAMKHKPLIKKTK